MTSKRSDRVRLLVIESSAGPPAWTTSRCRLGHGLWGGGGGGLTRCVRLPSTCCLRGARIGSRPRSGLGSARGSGECRPPIWLTLLVAWGRGLDIAASLRSAWSESILTRPIGDLPRYRAHAPRPPAASAISVADIPL